MKLGMQSDVSSENIPSSACVSFADGNREDMEKRERNGFITERVITESFVTERQPRFPINHEGHSAEKLSREWYVRCRVRVRVRVRVGEGNNKTRISDAWGSRPGSV
jgi:hypothetical protein